MLGKLRSKLLSHDKYGHPVAVHFNGETEYRTWLGLVCTLIVEAIVLQTLIVLAFAFFNNSRQEEKVNFSRFDRHMSEHYTLAENDIKFYIFPYMQQPVLDEHGNFLRMELQPVSRSLGEIHLDYYWTCAAEDAKCIDKYGAGANKRKVDLGDCPSETADELYAYYKSRNEFKGEFAKFAKCVSSDEYEADAPLSVQGDPFSWSLSSVLHISFKPCKWVEHAVGDLVQCEEPYDDFNDLKSKILIDIVID